MKLVLAGRSAAINTGNDIANTAKSMTRTQRAYAPVAETEENIPIVEDSKLRQKLIDDASSAYDYTPEANDRINNTRMFFQAGKMNGMQGYASGGDMFFPRDGASPSTTTHEFLHTTGDMLPNANDPDALMQDADVNNWWDWRKTAWGKEYMAIPGADFNERQSTVGTELDNSYLTPEIKQYYSPLMKAGKYPQLTNTLTRIIRDKRLKPYSDNDLAI